MPIGPTSGFLDFTNATPRANVVVALSKIGIGTDVPLHALDLRGTANVADIIINNDLTLTGGLTTNTLTINSMSMSTTSNFQQVTNVGNVTTNTVEFTNPTTGLAVTSNAEVGGELSVSGNATVSQELSVSGNATVSQELSVSGNVEVGTANLFVDTTTGNLGVGTAEPQARLHVGGTDGIIIPYGTTAQQPAGLMGMIRFNTSFNKLQVYNGTNWATIGGMSAAGGTVFFADGYTIHAFTTSGTFTVYSGGVIDCLLVAGGGGGGGSAGGGASGAGGGAGGVILDVSRNLLPGSYSINVGGGGTGVTGNTDNRGGNGGNTTGFGLTAIGGGGGGSRDPGNSQGRDGGSGGGEGSQGTGTPGYGSGTSGQGYRGGLDGFSGNTAIQNASGGGGGAGGVGGDGLDDNYSGDGGVGLNMSAYFTTSYGENGYFGGGGGGGTPGTLGNRQGSGGNGGGGDGGNYGGSAGTPNTGGGGGGAGSNGSAGAGGSGIVLIRYAN